MTFKKTLMNGNAVKVNVVICATHLLKTSRISMIYTMGDTVLETSYGADLGV